MHSVISHGPPRKILLRKFSCEEELLGCKWVLLCNRKYGVVRSNSVSDLLAALSPQSEADDALPHKARRDGEATHMIMFCYLKGLSTTVQALNYSQRLSSIVIQYYRPENTLQLPV